MSLFAAGQELPKPTFANSFIVSIEHPVYDSAEVDYIKNNFNFGLYARLSLSRCHVDPDLPWHADWSDADNGIQFFKDTVNFLVGEAKSKNVGLHIVLCSGLARAVDIYRRAKEEDVRNGQWYSDNNLASDSQIADPNAMDSYIWGTLSRYARKLRVNLEAKTKAALAFIKQKMDGNPDVLITLSGWGELELNNNRIDTVTICDYSPFAVMEFRDWIQHAGLYDDSTGAYQGQGYSAGGTKYQGGTGLTKFNSDFKTNFSSWNLKYFNWSLADPVDIDPTDNFDPDPRWISFSSNSLGHLSYSHGNMMPTSGTDFTPGGFDPPRSKPPAVNQKFWNLWTLFRQTMVHNLTLDAAKWASEAGISPDRWYSHQIPADYLWGTNPAAKTKSTRYDTSASPLWTADVVPYGSVGATIFDLKVPLEWGMGEFIRTTEYILPDISAMSADWAVLEYDAETYWYADVPPPQSSPDFILNQYLHVYNYSPHLMNFWRWIDAPCDIIKGTNKELALRSFVQKIRDKARNTNLSTVFTPPKLIGLSGQYNGGAQLQITGKIWDTEAWEWKTWGDFLKFEIFRGTSAGFTVDSAHKIGETANYAFTDSTAAPGTILFYKWRAVNVNSVAGPASDPVQVGGGVMVLNPPNLSSPSNGAANQATSVTFQWADTNTSPNESGCKLRIKPAGGSYTEYTLAADATSYPLSGLSYGTTYLWSVQAVGNGSVTDSTWPADWTFSTTGNVLMNVQYITVRGPDSWLYSRSMNTSEVMSAWAKLNGKTDVTPATALFNGKLYVVVKSDIDTKIYYNSMDAGGVWGSWVPMDGLTPDKPSIAVFNDKLYIAVRGTDDKIYFRSMTAAETFSPWYLVPMGLTSVPPAIRAFNNKLYLVVKDSIDDKVWWNKMDTADAWAGWNLMDGLSPSTPSLTAFNGLLYVAVRGPDNKIYYRTMSTADVFTAWGSITGFTDVSPVIEAFNGKVYMVVKSDVDMTIWWNSMTIAGVWGSFAPMDGLSPTTASMAAPLF